MDRIVANGLFCELYWSKKSSFLSMEDHCRYMFIGHVESRAYSASLKYRQACRSVVVAHKLQYIQHHHHLLVASGPEQNYMEVERDFSDLPKRMDELLENPDKAERIANNSVKYFRERYLTPAAEACYWRSLWEGWAEVSANVTHDVKRLPVDRDFGMNLLCCLTMTAQGSLRGFGQNLQGRFFAEGNQIEVTGSFSQSVDNFDAPSVTLTYEDLADLQGTYNIVIDVPPSYVGAADLSLNLKNVQNKTASISGPMVPPTSGRQSVSGFVRFGWAM
ncbi:hypothetical protein BDV37DRAFT_289942 [Aspergillus pseudonomiae]|uniref:Glycosyl transferase CAP10 domain-containing protein n=1 Tax=Aspergillus pseudonomiae TaxID=1506151 RepID=A0A5N7CSC3_9EURO|nr:uncharacterized protein BDV37DRAFT_289942 [Aspergillus pseudonomiae]KAE8396829.1 hypothetical protein BDV37DRAFT_289942 [Aspergillus pseudonomiae]